MEDDAVKEGGAEGVTATVKDLRVNEMIMLEMVRRLCQISITSRVIYCHRVCISVVVLIILL